MKKIYSNFLIIFILSCITFIAIQASRGDDRNRVIMIYNSWSVVSRDLRPVAADVASKNSYQLLELDIDNPNTQNDLMKLKLSAPSQTPFVAVMRNGTVVFQKAYPSSAPDLLRADLNKALGQ